MLKEFSVIAYITSKIEYKLNNNNISWSSYTWNTKVM